MMEHQSWMVGGSGGERGRGGQEGFCKDTTKQDEVKMWI